MSFLKKLFITAGLACLLTGCSYTDASNSPSGNDVVAEQYQSVSKVGVEFGSIYLTFTAVPTVDLFGKVTGYTDVVITASAEFSPDYQIVYPDASFAYEATLNSLQYDKTLNEWIADVNLDYRYENVKGYNNHSHLNVPLSFEIVSV